MRSICPVCVLAIGGLLATTTIASYAMPQSKAPAAAPAKPMMSDKKDIVDTAMAAGSFNTLCTALKAADWVEALKGKGPFTVFAPTDEAFAKLPKGTVETLLKPENKEKLAAILTDHVVAGEIWSEQLSSTKIARTVLGQNVRFDTAYGPKVNDSNITKADITCSNGVIHVIDSVIMPGDVVDVAVWGDAFKTLVAAVKAADLVDVLKSEGPFTVLAPTDEAFAKLPKGTVENLLKPENKEQLKNLLLYHVVSGRNNAAAVMGMSTAKTLQGQSISITVKDKTVMINGAKVISADWGASNGVVHAIDSVIMPK